MAIAPQKEGALPSNPAPRDVKAWHPVVRLFQRNPAGPMMSGDRVFAHPHPVCGCYGLAASANRFAGQVIAMTPARMHTKPSQAIGISVSPRNSTPMATPIGTRI